jgi:hypothetical protein
VRRGADPCRAILSGYSVAAAIRPQGWPCRGAGRGVPCQLSRWSTTASAVRREQLFDGRREAGARFDVGAIPKPGANASRSVEDRAGPKLKGQNGGIAS